MKAIILLASGLVLGGVCVYKGVPRMPTVLAVETTDAYASKVDRNPPPEPFGDKSRFQIVASTLETPMGTEKKTIFRVDTFTGKTWQYATMPYPGGRSAVEFWEEMNEGESNVVKSWRDAVRASIKAPPNAGFEK